jgi:hypothetical protein
MMARMDPDEVKKWRVADMNRSDNLAKLGE